MKKFLLLLPVLVILISGCTLPSWIPFSGGDTTISYENDIVIIENLQAFPSLVKSSQQIRVVGYVKNKGSEKVTVSVNMYDYCTTLFDSVSVSCGDGSMSGSECTDIELLPGETKEIDWTLVPSEVELTNMCDLKIAVTYKYTTTTMTDIHFMNSELLYSEEFKTEGSYITKGEGPVKAYLTVEDKQPVPTTRDPSRPDHTTVKLQIENVGSGYVKGNAIEREMVDVDLGGLKTEECPFAPVVGRDIKLIDGKKSAGIPCKVRTPSDDEVPKETTRRMEVKLVYDYEFRDRTKVTIEP